MVSLSFFHKRKRAEGFLAYTAPTNIHQLLWFIGSVFYGRLVGRLFIQYMEEHGILDE